jgi:hypothetical protein
MPNSSAEVGKILWMPNSSWEMLPHLHIWMIELSTVLWIKLLKQCCHGWYISYSQSVENTLSFVMLWHAPLLLLLIFVDVRCNLKGQMCLLYADCLHRHLYTCFYLITLLLMLSKVTCRFFLLFLIQPDIWSPLSKVCFQKKFLMAWY